ncbi:restriction endonuclease subunit M [Elizabethkingia anophelis]|uniref:restriction endonuclease subunit M n=1 Tax=Elizabethkingia anophelis TaxID=1117645 RepID=UPI00301CCEF2
MISKNKFCSLKELTNEASVEILFINKLLDYLKYPSSDISFKESISEIVVGKGSKKILYKPDYVIKTKGIPTIVIDAKSPKEVIDKWESQCSSYCLEINKHYEHNPVQFFILSNGLKTSLYKWDEKKPIFTLNFDDFVDTSIVFSDFDKFINRNNVNKLVTQQRENLDSKPFLFQKITLEQLFVKFQRLHQEIWKNEKKGPSAAFIELLKIIFVKIQKDKELHEKTGKSNKPKYKDVVFSANWIANQTESDSPVNDILFKNLINGLEKEISRKKKKRFFDTNERILLSPETIKKVVKEIENIDLYGMEEDIHGRMFEAFLDATVRGKDIGQFFTPRDVVQFMVLLANLKVSKTHVDKVLDACCGSGGFLISSLIDMHRKARALKRLTISERENLISEIQTKSIYGIDAGSDPAMYKIARMNMYLHGDGGSNIFYGDSLDKSFGRVGDMNNEVEEQLEELRKIIVEQNLKFDVILSNPPFSLQYHRDNKEQGEILNQYDISTDREQGKILNSLISSVMFIERYKDLIKEDGKIIAIIDDSVLSGASYSHIRNYIRNNFSIEAIISLPGDCFRRASARVKTSILILQLKDPNEDQKNIFLASSVYLGIESKIAKRIGIKTLDLEAEKNKEINLIIEKYNDYLSGNINEFVYPIENCQERLDVKYCIKDRGRKTDQWLSKGYKVTTIEGILKLASDRETLVNDDEQYQLLIVNYDGEVLDGDILEGYASSYNKLYRTEDWDILISNMGFGRGAISIVPPYHRGKYVSNEYTILRAVSKEEAVFYSNLLRTKEILGDILASTTGMNRGRIKWDVIKTVKVPVYKEKKEITQLTKEMEAFWNAYESFFNNKQKHMAKVSNELDINGKESEYRWLSFKPPE